MVRAYRCIRSTSVALLAAFTVAPALAQSDLPVTTVRERAVAPLPASAKVSEQPRYFLDTIDNLNRTTDDLTRKAPGLAKNNYIAKIYPVYNTNAIEIQSYLLRSLAYEGGTCEVMGGGGVTDGSGKAVQYLFVTAPDFMIPGITEIVSLADRPGFTFNDQTGADFGKGAGAVRYVGKHRTASELVAILSGTELGNVGAFLFPPFADDSTNSIYVVENPTDIGDSIAALEMFDTPPLQVELEVRVFEIADGGRSKLGLDWDSWKRFFSGGMVYSDIDTDAPFGGTNATWETVLALDATALTEFLNYTVQTGTANLLTTARITMVNSEDVPGGLSGGARGLATGAPAAVSTMTALPYVRTVGSNELRAESVPEPVEEGIEIQFLPFIGTESVTMSVGVTISSLIGFSGEENVPIVSTRTSTSVVNLADGEYLVLSGLKKQQYVSSRVGIPLLKEIPVLKYLFSKEVKDTTGSDILISLRPRIKKADSAATAALNVGF
jgi:hypothetical protein